MPRLSRRSTTVVGLWIAATTSTSAAFTSVARGALARTGAQNTAFTGRSLLPPSRVTSSPASGVSKTTTGLQMSFLSNLFGIQEETKIVYDGLPFPGNELGEAAAAGKVLTTSPQRPDLAVSSFAGGCFWGLVSVLACLYWHVC